MATLNKDLGAVTAYGFAKDGGYTGTVQQFESDLASIGSSLAGKADLVNGKVPASELPSFVDDVIEGYYDSTLDKFYENELKTVEITPETGKIYVDLGSTPSATYRWSGSTYVPVGNGSGHTILNSSGTSMTQRDDLQFVGATVTDDSTNGRTVVTVPDISVKLNESNVSLVETTLTASKAYAVNDPFIYNGQLYKANSAIVQGGTIVITGTGQNATPTTIEELISLNSGGVTGVKGNSESTYRTGNVNITPANVGAVATSSVKTSYQSSPSSGQIYDAAYINNLAGCEAVQVTTSGWSSGTTSVAGKSCYYKSITLTNAVYGIPEIKLKPANGTPTASEEEQFNCLDYYGVDSASPNTLKVYAVTKPTSSFYIWVIRNGGRV